MAYPDVESGDEGMLRTGVNGLIIIEIVTYFGFYEEAISGMEAVGEAEGGLEGPLEAVYFFVGEGVYDDVAGVGVLVVMGEEAFFDGGSGGEIELEGATGGGQEVDGEVEGDADIVEGHAGVAAGDFVLKGGVEVGVGDSGFDGEASGEGFLETYSCGDGGVMGALGEVFGAEEVFAEGVRGVGG